MRNGAPRGADGARGPYIVAVDDDKDARERVLEALGRRYGTDYRIAGYASGEQALDALRRLRDDGDEVAVILADQWMPHLTGAELLARATEHRPLAKRGLLIDWGAWGHEPTAEAILGPCDGVRSTTTSPSPGACATSSSTARSPSSCTSGRGWATRRPRS